MRVGYSHLGSPMPSRRILSVARVGVEPTNDHQGLSLAALPVCVPCRRASPMGFEPMISTVTGWRALQAAPRGRMRSPMSCMLALTLALTPALALLHVRRSKRKSKSRSKSEPQKFGEKDSNLHRLVQSRAAYH